MADEGEKTDEDTEEDDKNDEECDGEDEEDKDEAVAKVKSSGLGLMKAVKAANNKKK